MCNVFVFVTEASFFVATFDSLVSSYPSPPLTLFLFFLPCLFHCLSFSVRSEPYFNSFDNFLRLVPHGQSTWLRAEFHVNMGNALMPFLFSLGQLSGLEATHGQLRVNEKFGSTWAKHTCGISSEWNLLFVWFTAGSRRSTVMFACGRDLGCPPMNSTFAFWVLEQATLIS